MFEENWTIFDLKTAVMTIFYILCGFKVALALYAN